MRNIMICLSICTMLINSNAFSAENLKDAKNNAIQANIEFVRLSLQDKIEKYEADIQELQEDLTELSSTDYADESERILKKIQKLEKKIQVLKNTLASFELVV